MKKFFWLLFVLFIMLIVSFNSSSVVTAAPVGNYAVLNGGYLKTLNPYLGSTGQLTFEAWIYPTDTSGFRNIISIGEKNNNKFHYNFGLNGGSLTLNYRFGSGSQAYISAGNVSENSWSHVAGIISQSSSKLFINGQQVLSTGGASNLSSLTDSIVVGGSFDQSNIASGRFMGNIDEVRISSVSRNISSDYNLGILNAPLGTDSSTILLWHLDGIRGESAVVDSASNGLYGVLVGADSAVHYFGFLPSPTPFTGGFPFPTSRINRPTWVLPTIGFPNPTAIVFPTQSSLPSVTPMPVLPGTVRGPRPTRPF